MGGNSVKKARRIEITIHEHITDSDCETYRLIFQNILLLKIRPEMINVDENKQWFSD